MMKNKTKRLISGIKGYLKKNNYEKAVVGLSGGVDSALTLILLAKALGNENVFAIIMPENGVTLKQNVNDAVALAKSLGVRYYIVPMTSILKGYSFKWKENETSKANLRARVRANVLYSFANTHNCLVAGTSNKSELMLGYFTKYGDGAVDFEVIGSLFKTEVYEMARYLKLPARIIAKTPSAELYCGQTDEAELGRSYSEIDLMLKKKKRMAKDVKKRIEGSEHKRRVPLVISC